MLNFVMVIQLIIRWVGSKGPPTNKSSKFEDNSRVNYSGFAGEVG